MSDTNNTPSSEQNENNEENVARVAIITDKKKITLPSVILFICTLVIAIMPFISFAVHTTEVGDTVTYGESQGLFTFAFVGEDSLVAKIGDIFSGALFDMGSNDAEAAVAGMTSLVGDFIQTMALLGFSIYFLIRTVIYLIMGIVCFFAKKECMLIKVTLSCLARNLVVYFFFGMFGGVSGGSGASAYYLGFTVPILMSIVNVVGVVAVIIVALLNFKKKKEAGFYELDTNRKKYFRALIAGIAFVVICFAISGMRLYSVLNAVTSTFVTLLASAVSGAFTATLLLYPMLNILIIVLYMIMLFTSMSGFKRAFLYTCFDAEGAKLEKTKIERIEKKSVKCFIPFIIFALICIAAYAVLSTPTFGIGWTSNIFAYLVVIFAASSIAQTFTSVLKVAPEVKKPAPAAESEDEEESESESESEESTPENSEKKEQ